MTEQGAGVHRSCYLRLTKQGPETAPKVHCFCSASLHVTGKDKDKDKDKEGNKTNVDLEHTKY